MGFCMARRKSSVFDDLVGIATYLPWWLNGVLALISYGAFHYYATQPVAPAPDLKHMGEFLVRQYGQVFSVFLQYIVPAAFLLGTLISSARRLKAMHLHQRVTQAPSRNALESMGWQEFEMLVGETFRRRGFDVQQRGGAGPDGGVDLELHVGQDKYLVQCKQWKSRSVGVVIVRELYGVMAAEGAVGGFVVASGDFTEEAKRFAEGRSIELLGTDTLLELVKVTGGEVPEFPLRSNNASKHACPQCSSPMVLRTARRGNHPGKRFWGCSRYPGCKGVREA